MTEVLSKGRRTCVRQSATVAASVALFAVVGWSTPAEASSKTYSFKNISTDLDPGETATAQEVGANINMIVSDAGTSNGNNVVEFVFQNNNTVASSINQIYFNDGGLLGATMNIIGGDNVSFEPGASPPTLPGWVDYFGPPGPPPSPTFAAQPQTPQPQQNAINPGEELAIEFELAENKTYGDVITSINSGMSGAFDPETDLVVGLHVQGIGPDGFSASFVVIPLPAPVAMGLLGLLGVGAMTRRRFMNSAGSATTA